ncbi:Retrotransposable element Tf2 protein type 1-like protein, partial [Dinothrombium tinctorium]
KQELEKATLLAHPIPGAQLSVWVDASDSAIGGALMQLNNDDWQPISFLSMKLKDNQKK